MSYTLTNYSYIIRDADQAVIPETTENPDYRKYLLWLEEGNVPAPAPQPE